MFKNIIIAFLAVFLIAGAASSRPGEDSFKVWYRQRAKVLEVAAPPQKKGLIERIFHGKGDVRDAESCLDKCVYRDRLLWADIEMDGKVICTGAFNRWVAYEDVSGALKAKADKG